MLKWDIYLQNGSFLYNFVEQQPKKQGHMRTLTIFYNSHLLNIFKKYHKNQAEALAWWKNRSKKYTDEKILLMKDLKRTGHKYEIACRGIDSWGEEYFKYIHCYSKKEAIFVIGCIKEFTDKYLITLKKLY